MLCFGRIAEGDQSGNWALVEDFDACSLDALTSADSAAVSAATRRFNELVLRGEGGRVLWHWEAGLPLVAVGGEGAGGAEQRVSP